MSEGKRILIIDDDELLAEMLVVQLSDLGGFHCVSVPDAAAGLREASGAYFDLILLDLNLPDKNGIEVCRMLRDAGVRAPVVMLTVDDSEAAMIDGFAAGAIDYVTKPFKLGVLLARIRAHIRQFEHSEDAILHIGAFAFRPGAKTLTRLDGAGANGERPVRLTDKEAQILKFLYLRAQEKTGDSGGAVAREELLDEVWGYNAGVTTHTLETHIYRLRQKIEREPSQAELLVTVPGGYLLKA